MFLLPGKVALITGGANGIGLAVAKELLHNGVKGVALVDIDSQNGIAAEDALSKEFSKERVIYINADVSERSQFQGAFDKTIDSFNQLDIVVNNAGIVHELQWEKCISVNLQGCITGSLLALDKYFPTTLGSSEGIILNMSSLLGLIPAEYAPVYAATKHGIVGFSRSLSGPNRCRNVKVKVLTVCPGWTPTNISKPSTDRVPADMLQCRRVALQTWKPQTAEQLATHIVSIIENGTTGSVWKVENDTKEEVIFPTLFKA